MRKVMEFLFRAASLVVDTIRTFFLIVLSVLGPIAFAISVFDGFQGTLVQWLARYISVYLWLPISDLLGVMLAKIQTLVLQSEMEMIQDPLSVFSPDGSTGHLSGCSCSSGWWDTSVSLPWRTGWYRPAAWGRTTGT